jgi:PAT family beta-lactamase induction signal transducer AmpG
MLAFGFSSGLPFALLIGTLNAWLGEAKINLATIGVLSWIGLSYSFKFLWSPVVDRFKLPGLERLGRRKSWILLCQAIMIAGFAGLAATNPATNIGTFAIFAIIAALASATQDVAVDAWRIDVANEQTPVELLSAIYQFGYRIASIVGGALALVMAARMSWSLVYLLMGGLIALMALVALQAPDTERPDADVLHKELEEPGALEPRARSVALAIVGISWAWAIFTIGRFMISMLTTAPGEKQPSVADFTKAYGPWIIFATVIVPLIVSSLINWLRARKRHVLREADRRHTAGRNALNHLYVALVAPLGELSGRLGWGVLIVLGLILTYTLCYNIWSSFAFPFYLDFLHYSKDEVAFASKVFGIFMTMVGIALGGYLFARLGRLPTVLIGAILPVFGNFVYADLAEGGASPRCGRRNLGSHAIARPVRVRRTDGSAAPRHLVREYLHRNRRCGVRRLSLGHRQQALHRGPICAAVVADLPHRLARARDRRRGVRYLWLCDRIPLDSRGRRVRGSLRCSRMDARHRRRPARKG